MLTAGIDLRKIRERLGLTMRDVENASMVIAQRRGSDEYLVPPSRLSDIETKGVIPSVFRFYSLAAIYRKPVRFLLQFYGIDLDEINFEWTSAQPARSHIVTMENDRAAANVPIKMDPGFDLNETSDLGRMVQQWGLVPLTLLSGLATQDYTYAYIGNEDYTMHPILPPGSFIQVDESRRRVAERHWRSEYERPIYFVETRDGFTCCWCSLRPNALVLQGHPLSPVPVRILRHPQEAEVIGQVVGVAMRIGNQNGCEPPASRESSESRSSAVLTPSGNPKATTGAGLTSVLTRKKLG
ncbi:MAG: helix-turn-helix transcriptional regulator [Terriglobales bacterium]|jgi:transcriptional regulator with XRE-family HTH domain